MWPGRIAFAFVLVWSLSAFTLAAVIFINLGTIEPPERYLILILGLVMLYVGGSLAASLIWPAKPKDRNAPIEIPPLDQVRGRTSYRDDGAKWRNVVLAIGAIFLFVSLTAAAEQPIVLVIAVIAVGILAGAGVMTWRQIQYGIARLELQGPARRGDVMHGVITTSGSGWVTAGRGLYATVEVSAIRTYRRTRGSDSVVVAESIVDAAVTQDGKDITFRFTITVPVIDTSEGRFSWNVQLETQIPKYRATFLVDVG